MRGVSPTMTDVEDVPTAAAAVVSDIAEMLSVVTGHEVVPVYGGFRLRTIETHFIDVTLMLVNWRVIETRRDFPAVFDRYWCFGGTGLATLLRAARAVADWDCAADTEPEGWVKNGQTGELRHDGR
jgi:hypothetical protein